MRLKLTREELIGTTVQQPGFEFDAEGMLARMYVESGAAVPVPAAGEQATREPADEPRAEKATRHR